MQSAQYGNLDNSLRLLGLNNSSDPYNLNEKYDCSEYESGHPLPFDFSDMVGYRLSSPYCKTQFLNRDLANFFTVCKTSWFSAFIRTYQILECYLNSNYARTKWHDTPIYDVFTTQPFNKIVKSDAATKTDVLNWDQSRIQDSNLKCNISFVPNGIFRMRNRFI